MAGSRSVGYGKAAMVFHMMRERLGDQLSSALSKRLFGKNNSSASRGTIGKALLNGSRNQLGWFFAQWLERKGLPEIQVSGFAVTQEARGSRSIWN